MALQRAQFTHGVLLCVSHALLVGRQLVLDAAVVVPGLFPGLPFLPAFCHRAQCLNHRALESFWVHRDPSAAPRALHRLDHRRDDFAACLVGRERVDDLFFERPPLLCRGFVPFSVPALETGFGLVLARLGCCGLRLHHLGRDLRRLAHGHLLEFHGIADRNRVFHHFAHRQRLGHLGRLAHRDALGGGLHHLGCDLRGLADRDLFRLAHGQVGLALDHLAHGDLLRLGLRQVGHALGHLADRQLSAAQLVGFGQQRLPQVHVVRGPRCCLQLGDVRLALDDLLDLGFPGVQHLLHGLARRLPAQLGDLGQPRVSRGRAATATATSRWLGLFRGVALLLARQGCFRRLHGPAGGLGRGHLAGPAGHHHVGHVRAPRHGRDVGHAAPRLGIDPGRGHVVAHRRQQPLGLNRRNLAAGLLRVNSRRGRPLRHLGRCLAAHVGARALGHRGAFRGQLQRRGLGRLCSAGLPLVVLLGEAAHQRRTDPVVDPTAANCRGRSRASSSRVQVRHGARPSPDTEFRAHRQPAMPFRLFDHLRGLCEVRQLTAARHRAPLAEVVPVHQVPQLPGLDVPGSPKLLDVRQQRHAVGVPAPGDLRFFGLPWGHVLFGGVSDDLLQLTKRSRQIAVVVVVADLLPDRGVPLRKLTPGELPPSGFSGVQCVCDPLHHIRALVAVDDAHCPLRQVHQL